MREQLEAEIQQVERDKVSLSDAKMAYIRQGRGILTVDSDETVKLLVKRGFGDWHQRPDLDAVDRELERLIGWQQGNEWVLLSLLPEERNEENVTR